MDKNMNCVKCGKSIQDDAVFCPYCGKKQVKLPRKNPTRANGTGSVYYDSRAKKWVAQIVAGKHYTDDKKLRFSYKRQYFEKKSDALKSVGKLEEEKKARPDFTVSYYYVSFSNGKGCTLSNSKQAAYKIAYNRLKTLWATPMKDLTINDLQAVISASCASYDTARDVRALLNYLFKLAAADDRSINPVLPSLVQLPKQEETQVEPFTEEEQLKLWFSYESGNMDAAIPLIMIYTGMMTGEMRKLSKEMVHLEDHEIVGVGLKTRERKKKSVLLPDDIIPVLEDVISKTETDVLYPVSKDAFYRRYYKVLKHAGIKRDLSPYSCRHTTATVLAVHENVAPQTLQRVMRWKSTRMMDRYVTPSDQDARTAVNRI
jgi:integrase